MLLIILQQKYCIKSCLEHKTQMNATFGSSGPSDSSHQYLYKRRTVFNVLYLDID